MTFYAKMLEHDYTSKDQFNLNFFSDWRDVMTHEEKKIIKSWVNAILLTWPLILKNKRRLGRRARKRRKRLKRRVKTLWQPITVSASGTGTRKKSATTTSSPQACSEAAASTPRWAN